MILLRKYKINFLHKILIWLSLKLCVSPISDSSKLLVAYITVIILYIYNYLSTTSNLRNVTLTVNFKLLYMGLTDQYIAKFLLITLKLFHTFFFYVIYSTVLPL